MSRPQVGIDRLPARRTNEQPKEAMNCKSCRKRKIKCNRLRPSCEACQIFSCPCVYDAIPKKRGPKTDVLEALLKRVDGLEKRLQHDGDQSGDNAPVGAVKAAILEAVRNSSSPDDAQMDTEAMKDDSVDDSPADASSESRQMFGVQHSSPGSSSCSFPSNEYAVLLLDTYFGRIHGKPYNVFDEASTRQRFLNNSLPQHLSFAIFAVTARYTSNFGSYEQTLHNAREYARQARADLDIDEPSIEGLQTLLLLSQAMFQEGVGKKAYMFLSSAITMALALNVHRELPANVRISPLERECRRRLFWSCYLMDRFAACGSKRPSLISDESIILRLPSGDLESMNMGFQAEFFPNNANLQFMSGIGNAGPESWSMLIGIARILGTTNRYLAAGGVKGDSHFPWHAMSTLSKIRSDLDMWASDTQEAFSSIETLFGRPDSVIMVMSKLIYHLIYCLVYRPFLPVDLAELERTSQHQSWQIDATNLCFLHANAITELVEIGKQSAIIDWPAFVSYCVCTAGTIHVHGAHYQGQVGDVYSMSAEFLSREVQQLTDFRFMWGGIQHQKDTLQTLYGAHSELVQSLASNPLRFSPVFQMEDFFDRYPGYQFDGSHITLSDASSQPQPYSRQNSNTDSQAITSHPALYRANSEQNAGRRPTGLLPTLGSKPSKATKKRRSTGPALLKSRISSEPGSSEFATTMQQPYLISPIEQPQQYFNNMHFNSALQTPTDPNMSYASSTNFMPVDFSGMSSNTSLQGGVAPESTGSYDPMLSMPPQYDQSREIATPRAMLAQMASNTYGGAQPGGDASMGVGVQQEDADPFLALLEQLAENEHSRGGPSELDFFLSGTS